MKRLYTIKKSKIHNNGVYALRNIPKNTRIIQYKGEKISKEEGTKRLEKSFDKHKIDTNHAATYIFELNDEFDLDGDVPENDAKYINHSCEPNCDFEIKNDDIWIFANRDIKKGEELSYNYGFDFDDKYHEQPCKCGKKNCLGYIVAEEDVPILKKHLEKKD